MMKKFLILQTAFIGDVILASALVEKLHQHFPDAQIDFVLRKGNEALFAHHPILQNIFIWNKKQDKLKNLRKLIYQIRETKYDYLINLQRFLSSGLISLFANAEQKIGFDKNPLSIFYSLRVKHQIGNGKHEVERNHDLIAAITDSKFALPRLYPSLGDFDKVKPLKLANYICVAPTSVWFTKQFPISRWAELIQKINTETNIYLLGAPTDKLACDKLISLCNRQNISNLAGSLSFLESAALMKDAAMNYVNDSAPLHIASAVNAKVTAVFCSTIPAFGFGPLGENAKIVETRAALECRPCGLHGNKICPQQHFRCAMDIDIAEMI